MPKYTLSKPDSQVLFEKFLKIFLTAKACPPEADKPRSYRGRQGRKEYLPLLARLWRDESPKRGFSVKKLEDFSKSSPISLFSGYNYSSGVHAYIVRGGIVFGV